MSNKMLFEIGETKVYLYQRIIAVVGIVLFFFFSVVAIVTQNEYYKLFPVVVLVLFAAITFMYSIIYSVRVSQGYFYVRNIFKKKRISSEEFIQVKSVKGFDLLMVVVFQKERFFVMKKSKNFYKDLFKSKDNVAKELTLDVKRFIDKG